MGAPKTKNRANPYLFILFKRLIEYEVVKNVADRPSFNKVASFLYIRTRNKVLKSVEKLEATETAMTLSQRFRKHIFTPIDFEFTSEILDSSVKEITLVGPFKNWSRFENEFKLDRGYIEAESRFMGKRFSEYSTTERDQIASWVEIKMLEIHLRSVRLNKPHKHVILFDGGSFAIRNASPWEMNEFLNEYFPFPFVKSRYHYHRLQITRCQRAIENNENTSFLFKDDYGILGLLVLIPIKLDTIRRIKSGELNFLKIGVDDIVAPPKMDHTEYLYIETFYFANKQVLNHFVFLIEKMVTSMLRNPSRKLTIGAVAKSDNGQQVSRALHFRKVTDLEIADSEDSVFLKFPFFEIEFLKLIRPTENLSV